jgi:hypothetical protein
MICSRLQYFGDARQRVTGGFEVVDKREPNIAGARVVPVRFAGKVFTGDNPHPGIAPECTGGGFTITNGKPEIKPARGTVISIFPAEDFLCDDVFFRIERTIGNNVLFIRPEGGCCGEQW